MRDCNIIIRNNTSPERQINRPAEYAQMIKYGAVDDDFKKEPYHLTYLKLIKEKGRQNDSTKS